MWFLSVVFMRTIKAWWIQGIQGYKIYLAPSRAFLTEGTTGADLSFPPQFNFGAATASYQIEGAWNISGKGLSIWDTYTHNHQDQILDGANGDVACDSYHLWETDVEIAANLSLQFYRISLSWPRLLPNGFAANISEDGKSYYNKLIDGLLAKGIEPVVTLYHWDLPQTLQDLGGWANPYIANWFADYAEVVYSLYADRVKTWITINEPLVFNDLNFHRVLSMAPGIQDLDVGPYIAAKNILIAHAKAYRIYDEKYRPKFNGKVSIANHLIWYEGLTEADAESAELCMELTAGIYSQPIYSKVGGWPSSIENIIAENSRKEGYRTSRLPAFTQEEIKLVQGTFDFYAFNHYTSRAVRKTQPGESVKGPKQLVFSGMPELDIKVEGRPEWKPATSTWLLQNPAGLRNVLSWLKNKYGDIPILITENGYSSLGGDLEDDDRIKYYRDYLEQVLLSIHEDEVNVIGYTAWTLIDNYEWWDGYRSKFGLYEVNFDDPKRTRTPRKSARFYADVIKSRSLNLANNIKTEL